MSISLNSIDCRYLTDEFRQILLEKYSIATSNDFLLWSCQSSCKTNEHFSHEILQCIQTCIIAHTATILSRKTNIKRRIYRMNYTLFDEEDFFENHRHVMIIYEYFNQYQWNELFHHFLIRLMVNNSSTRIHYFNTNITLIDMKYIREDAIDFSHTFDLENFDKQLSSMENNRQGLDLIIIDDFFALIKPYLNLERRIKHYILQLIYRLNRLAQTHSILILTGLILPSKKRTMDDESSFPLDFFPADKYVRFQAWTSTNENEIQVRLIDERTNEKRTMINLEHWKENLQIDKKYARDVFFPKRNLLS